MRRAALVVVVCAALVAVLGVPAGAGTDARPHTTAGRIDALEQELDSLVEEVDDLREPVEEFDLFEECMYLIGVTEYGGRGAGFPFVGAGGRERIRPALAFDIRGFDRPQFQLLAFPGEEPPSIECNEDAGQEDVDD